MEPLILHDWHTWPGGRGHSSCVTATALLQCLLPGLTPNLRYFRFPHQRRKQTTFPTPVSLTRKTFALSKIFQFLPCQMQMPGLAPAVGTSAPSSGHGANLGSSRKHSPKEHPSSQTECVSWGGQMSLKTQEKGNTEGRRCEGKGDWKFGILQL